MLGHVDAPLESDKLDNYGTFFTRLGAKRPGLVSGKQELGNDGEFCDWTIAARTMGLSAYCRKLGSLWVPKAKAPPRNR
jgi:hypothetical protein